MTNIIEEKDWPEMAQTLQNFLACPCQYFAPMRDDEPIWQAYQAARPKGGLHAGFADAGGKFAGILPLQHLAGLQ